MNESRGNWYLLTGVIIGLGLGLVFAWVISPVKYVDTEPASLSSQYKDTYRRVIAMAYQSDHNLARARERLKLLDKEIPVQELAAQAQRMVAAKQSAQEAKALALLAADLRKPPEAAGQVSGTAQPSGTDVAALDKTAVSEPSPLATLAVDQAIRTPTVPLPSATHTATLTPTVTLTPRPTFTLKPTATVVPTLSAPFKLVGKRPTCDSTSRPGVLEIQVNDADGTPLPGVPIHVTWQDKNNTFYTGLIPEINPGYADFNMEPGVQYDLRVGDTSQLVTGLSSDGNHGCVLTFSQSN